jgi:predicted DNA-binding transcriptional regulator YafY
MAKRGYLWRYSKIIQKVQQQPYISKSELQQYLDKELQNVKYLDDEMEVGCSNRTLERDFREIRNLWGVSIEYSRAERGYYIEDDNHLGKTALFEMVNAFELLRSVNMVRELENAVYPEMIQPQGTEKLYDLIHAIKDGVRICFEYTPFKYEKPCNHSGRPIALKEFERRWYLLLKEDGENTFKIFGLDRINNIEITQQKIIVEPFPDVEAMFAPCLGVTIPREAEPQEIIISFTPEQAKYVKSLPLHHSQKIISETDAETIISINVYLNAYELEQKILSFGDTAKVIQPQMLADKIKKRLKNAVNKYES